MILSGYHKHIITLNQINVFVIQNLCVIFLMGDVSCFALIWKYICMQLNDGSLSYS
jgi:hypothetical protein